MLRFFKWKKNDNSRLQLEKKEQDNQKIRQTYSSLEIGSLQELPSNQQKRKESFKFQQRRKKNDELKAYTNILSARVWFWPVKSTVTGQVPESWHDELGKSAEGKDTSRAARYWGRGTCIRAGHSGGFAMRQLMNWVRDEYWGPHISLHVLLPLTGTHSQPHLKSGLSNDLSKIDCIDAKRRHIRIGYATMPMFVFMFLFCSSPKVYLLVYNYLSWISKFD